MEDNRFFLDTAYAQALLNPRDQHHNLARRLVRRVERAKEIWTTNFILAEIGDALSASNRLAASNYVNRILADDIKFWIVDVDRPLLIKGFALYQQRSDKDWGFTDCVSFEVMKEQNLIMALTTDQHFIQAGFRALMLEGN
jgi:uncharacterized protein